MKHNQTNWGSIDQNLCEVGLEVSIQNPANTISGTIVGVVH